MQNAKEIIGENIAQRWQIVDYLGEGCMSYVYKAQNIETGKTIVLKLVKSFPFINREDLETLNKQIKDFIALNHENIANYYDTHICDKGLFLFCDYLTGENLSSFLSRAGKLSIEQCIEFLKPIVAGLEYAHEKNILHGDLKPSNIFIVNDQFNINEPKVVDFGLMYLLAAKNNNIHKQNTNPSYPNFNDSSYISPEQRLGKDLDMRCDLYSIGCLMYELACGKPPFTSKSNMETTYRQKHKTPTELAQLVPDHPLLKRYQLVANKLLQPYAKDRYQLVSLVGQDLNLLTTAKEKEWQKKAHLFKQPKLNILLGYKWQSALGIIFAIIFISSICLLGTITAPYYFPWTSNSFDNDKLWLIQSTHSERPSGKILEQNDFLNHKLNEIAKRQGKTSADYIKTLFSLSQFQLLTGQPHEALINLNQLQQIESVDKLIRSPDLYANIAFAEYATGDLNMAEESAHKVLAVDQPNVQIENKITALQILGDIYNERNDIIQAEKMYEQMYNLAKNNRLHNAAEYAYSDALLADIWRRENKLQQSEKLYKEAIDWGSNYIGHRGLFVVKACYGLALLYYQKGNLKAADLELTRAMPIAISRLGSNDSFVIAMNSLSDYILFHQNIFAWLKAKIENIKKPQLILN